MPTFRAWSRGASESVAGPEPLLAFEACRLLRRRGRFAAGSPSTPTTTSSPDPKSSPALSDPLLLTCKPELSPKDSASWVAASRFRRAISTAAKFCFGRLCPGKSASGSWQNFSEARAAAFTASQRSAILATSAFHDWFSSAKDMRGLSSSATGDPPPAPLLLEAAAAVAAGSELDTFGEACDRDDDRSCRTGRSTWAAEAAGPETDGEDADRRFRRSGSGVCADTFPVSVSENPDVDGACPSSTGLSCVVKAPGGEGPETVRRSS